MKIPLLSVGTLAALLMTTGSAQAQAPLGNPWDGVQRNGAAAPRSYFSPAHYGHPAPDALVSNPGTPTQLESYGGAQIPEPAMSSGASVLGEKNSKAAALAGASSCRDCAHDVQWQIGADLMCLTRMSGSSYPLLRAWTPATSQYQTIVVSPSDFDYDYELGYRITASRLVSDGWGIEGSFFGMGDQWNYATEVTGFLQFSGAGLTLESEYAPDSPPTTPLTFRFESETEFYSADLNLTRGLCDWATCRAGIRYIQLNDELRVGELSVPFYNLLIANTKNTMIGPQAGVDLKLLDLCCCRLRVNATLNCGVLYNRVEEDPNSTVVGPPMFGAANEVTLMGEAALTAKYRLTENIAIRGGYQIMGLHNVALAPDQLISSDFSTGDSYIKMGSLLMHGASLGVEVFW